MTDRTTAGRGRGEQMTHGELFAGVSGFGLGFHRSGITTAWQVEIDPHARRVLKQHYRDIPHRADVRECGAMYGQCGREEGENA